MRCWMILLGLLLGLNLRVAGQSLPGEKVVWYDFYWDGDSTHPKDAMLLKSKIDTVDFTFRWQFDTGSPRTFFYGDTWNSFLQAFPYLKDHFFVTDSTKSDGYINVRSNKIKISGNELPKRTTGVLPNYGNNIAKDVILSNLGASTLIGTIGIDLFRNGVLIIDFKSNKIGYTAKLSNAFYGHKTNTIDFMLYQNRIILPLTIAGKKFSFFYDSGASLFPLKTTAALAKNLPAVTYTDTLKNITTWGKSYDVPGGNFKGELKIGTLKVKNAMAYVHPDPDRYHTKIFEEAETDGLIGNAYFDNKVIVIDFTRMKFSILD